MEQENWLQSNFYKGKRVLVTGHTGFKGTWLCRILLQLGAQVTGYALMPPPFLSLFEISAVSDKINSIEGDVRDFARLKEVFELFDDDVRVPSAMEYLCEACVYAASRQKPDGIGILLEHLHDIPEKGYHCGCEGIVRILSKKKYRERFQESLAGASEDTQVLVREILQSFLR